MRINFSVKYRSEATTVLTVRFEEGTAGKQMEIPLEDGDGVFHRGSINREVHPLLQKFVYSIIVRDQSMHSSEKVLISEEINLKKYKDSDVYIIHENLTCDDFTELSRTKPFKDIFKQKKSKAAKQASSKEATHIFNVKFPVLQDNKFVCLTGSAKKMNAFEKRKPLLFKKNKNNRSSLKLNLSKEKFPLEYKIAVYDTDQKTIVEYEPGPNQVLEQLPEKKSKTIIFPDHSFEEYAWKGAGINVPLFSLRSERSAGTGDFTDLMMLVDYAVATGLRLIQLLPLNDTTSTHSDNDSYPYSAISSFALHPKYVDIRSIAHRLNVEITEEEEVEINRLNGLSHCYHADVMKLKMSVLKKLFEKDRHDFINNTSWVTFFNMNREWLVPYAAFCTLRDKYNTPDFEKWEGYAKYGLEKLQHLTSTESDDYDTILFWYYVQYRLHLQLKEASDYAHKKGVALKADLPIGVGRYSADTWQYPELFDMKMQAGAPPDAFSDKGQNWGFPTYDLGLMAFDNYEWLRKRMAHSEYYFDAVRIDHVLGLFRIWSIPLNQVEGRMGKFVPAIPLGEHDFADAGLPLNEERYCYPFITDAVLKKKFGTTAEDVKKIFFEKGKLSPQYNDQKKIADHFRIKPANKEWEKGLMDIVSDVILFKEISPQGGYHFRINMEQTESYKHLRAEEKVKMKKLYDHYFYQMQNELWEKAGKEKLQMLKDSTTMLLCGEDLGMVPDFTERVLHSLDILTLQALQMPKKTGDKFSDVMNANYETVVMPATHDMAPIRLWWEQNRINAQVFYNGILKEEGTAPYFAEPGVCKKIINLHLQSPAMWSIFLLQDLLSINGKIRRPIPNEERINDPADPGHVWNYRMHITLEDLLDNKNFIKEIKSMIKESGR